jgi:hypothetical protein
MPLRLPKSRADEPWLAIVEFPSFSDAKAFQTLIAESFALQVLVRRKQEYRKQGAFASWRTTRIFREAYSARSFTAEMLSDIAIAHGYCGTLSAISTWLRKAKQEGLVAKVGKGEWEWVKPQARETAATLSEEPQCATPAAQ